MQTGATVAITITGEVVSEDPTEILTNSGVVTLSGNATSATVVQVSPPHVYASGESLPYPGAADALPVGSLLLTSNGVAANEILTGSGSSKPFWRFAGDRTAYTAAQIFGLVTFNRILRIGGQPT